MSGSISTLIISSTGLIALLGTFIVLILLTYQRNQAIAKKSIEEIKSTEEKNRLKLQIEVQEKTFQQISREMHDSLAHDLSASNLFLKTLDYPDHVSNKEKIDASIQLIGKVIQNIRDISKSLNSELIKRNGLFNTLEEEISIIRRAGFSSIDYRIIGDPFDIPADNVLFIFRIIQESFNNILKHSKATAIHLTLQFSISNLKIIIEDNGIGFDPYLVTQGPINSCGLSNIMERSKILQGTCDVISSPGNGTKVIVNIPILNSNTINHEHDHNYESSFSR